MSPHHASGYIQWAACFQAPLHSPDDTAYSPGAYESDACASFVRRTMLKTSRGARSWSSVAATLILSRCIRRCLHFPPHPSAARALSNTRQAFSEQPDLEKGFIEGLCEMLRPQCPGDVRAAVMHFISAVSQELQKTINVVWKEAMEKELTNTLAAASEATGKEGQLLCAMAEVALIQLGAQNWSAEPLSQLAELISPFVRAASAEAHAADERAEEAGEASDDAVEKAEKAAEAADEKAEKAADAVGEEEYEQEEKVAQVDLQKAELSEAKAKATEAKRVADKAAVDVEVLETEVARKEEKKLQIEDEERKMELDFDKMANQKGNLLKRVSGTIEQSTLVYVLMNNEANSSEDEIQLFVDNVRKSNARLKDLQAPKWARARDQKLSDLKLKTSRTNLSAAKGRSMKRDAEEEKAQREVETATEGLNKAGQVLQKSAALLKKKKGEKNWMDKEATKAKQDVVKAKAAVGTVTAVGEAKVDAKAVVEAAETEAVNVERWETLGVLHVCLVLHATEQDNLDKFWQVLKLTDKDKTGFKRFLNDFEPAEL
eukprot:scaffold21221_cov60-Phaeocystis_antarctica.AAC.5